MKPAGEDASWTPLPTADPLSLELAGEYQREQARFEALRRTVLRDIDRCLKAAEINTHHLTSRLKTPASLSEKLRRKPGRYRRLSDVTDLVGLRIITYFERDVSAVSRALESRFEVDWDNSVDKSKMLDPDRFGYMGVHYVLRFAGETEWRFEVQIRSILQHAWAEIEHDLGYKSREAVPSEVRRRFYRLAGLLEMADEEFMNIHHLSQHYVETLPERIAQDPDSVFVDAQSVAYLMNESEVQALDAQVAASLNVRLLRAWPDPERPQRLSSILHYVGVRSVGQLLKELRRLEGQLLHFAALLMPQLKETWVPAGGARPGTSLLHYALWRAASHAGIDAGEVINLLGLRVDLMAAQRVVQAAYQQVQDSRHEKDLSGNESR